MSARRHGSRSRAVLVALALVAPWVASNARAGRVLIPLVCSRGPSGHSYEVSLTAPAAVAPGAVFTVRVDGSNSGRISHPALNYVHDMTYEYLVPSGSGYVDRSAHIIEGTGTANVRTGARVSHAGGAIVLVLPARVEDGSSYTPPTFEFQLRATAAAGEDIAHAFAGYRITANAMVVGELKASCEPTPMPYRVAVTHVQGSGEP
jgi:hypothetical protein